MTFIKNSFITILARIFTFACALTISIYIARILGPTAKGAYSLLVQSVSILMLLGMLGINYPILYMLGKKKEQLEELYPNIVFIIAISSLILLIAFFLCLELLRTSVLKEIELSYILVVIFSLPALVLAKLSGTIIQSLNKIKLLNVLNIVSNALLLINFILFVVILKLGLFGACLGFLLSELLSSIIYTAVILKISRVSMKLNWSIIKDLLGFGLKALLIPFFLLLNYRLNFFLINHFMEIAMVGYFSVAFSFAEILFFIPEAVAVPLFPKLASSGLNSQEEIATRVIRVLFFFSAICALFFLIFGRRLVLFIYGPLYIYSVRPMQILLPGAIAISLYYLISPVFISWKRPGLISITLVITLFFNFWLNILLIPIWGINGAALASTIAYSICTLTLIGIFLKFTNQPLADVLMVKISDINYLLEPLRKAWTRDGKRTWSKANI